MLFYLPVLEEQHLGSIWELCLRDPLLAEQVDGAAVTELLPDVSIFKVNHELPIIVLEPPHSIGETHFVVVRVPSYQTAVWLLNSLDWKLVRLMVLSWEDHFVGIYCLVSGST